MIAARPIYCLARVTLEALSAHGIHSGQGDTTHDVLLIRDANGLPTVPGSSLAGVLRHTYSQKFGEATAGRLFGQLGENACPSWLNVSWALVHDGENRPCEGLLEARQIDDPLLQLLQDSKPLVRQRVRLDHTGTACDTGKFDVTLIPAGVRYTAWLGYWCDDSEASRQQWQDLLQLLATQTLYLGHGTRSGNGHFQVSELLKARWDLRTPEGQTAYVKRPRRRAQHHGLEVVPQSQAADTVQVRLQLVAESAWRVGGGERLLPPSDSKQPLSPYDKEPDLLPQHELKVEWKNNKANITKHYHLLPGSAVKGALRHRLAYHYRCLMGDFAGSGSSPNPEDCPAVTTLFGYAEEDQGQAGLLVFQDLQLHGTRTGMLMHNKIDRFTGGVINGALFSEEVLWKTPLELCIHLLPRSQSVDPVMRQALQRTLEDLANGWLPLGASSGRGLGNFIDPQGKGPQWSDDGAWVNAQEANA